MKYFHILLYFSYFILYLSLIHIFTENGLGAYDTLTEDGKVHDPYRIEYLRKHIEQIQLAITDGAEMMGYLSLIHISSC